MSLLRQGKAQALTIYIGESDQWRGTTLYVAITQYLRDHGCAGATVTRAIAGYGAGVQLQENQKWLWSSKAPVVIQVIDRPDRLARLLPELQEMVSGGLITLHEVEVLKYTYVRAHGIPTHLPVRSIMEPSVISIQPTTPIDAVINFLLDAPFRALPVVDNQKHLQGIISTGDLIKAGLFPMRRGLLHKALALDEQSAETIETRLAQARRQKLTAQDVMNTQVQTVGPDNSVREVAQTMMETGIRRLPVVSPDGILMGMVTRADMLQVVVTSPLMSPESTKPLSSGGSAANNAIPPQHRPIGTYALSDVAPVNEETSLDKVIEALVLSPFKRVVVVDKEQHVVGIISDVDVLTQLEAENRSGFLSWLTGWTTGKPETLPQGITRPHAGKARSAADVMNRDVITITEDTSVQQTVEHMMTTGRKVLPVVDAQNHLTGVVGRSDVLRILLES